MSTSEAVKKKKKAKKKEMRILRAQGFDFGVFVFFLFFNGEKQERS